MYEIIDRPITAQTPDSGCSSTTAATTEEEPSVRCSLGRSTFVMAGSSSFMTKGIAIGAAIGASCACLSMGAHYLYDEVALEEEFPDMSLFLRSVVHIAAVTSYTAVFTLAGAVAGEIIATLKENARNNDRN